jgi:ABC-type sugar transport system ATPase subunit
VTAVVGESTLPAEAERETLVEVRSLAVAYGDVRAVDGVDLAIKAGEISSRART